MKYIITPMVIDDYDEIYKIWDNTEGIFLGESDSKRSLMQYLERNPELSFVAKDERGYIIGAILCGHDGVKGYIRHLAVRDSFRKNGIGKNLVTKSLSKLKLSRITKCSIFLLKSNEDAEGFWNKISWINRNELKVMSTNVLTNDSFSILNNKLTKK